MSRLIFSLVLITLLPLLSLAQEKEYITIGFNGGIDQNINAYKLDTNDFGNSFSKTGMPYNLGIDFSIMASDKIRPRFEFKYMESHYKAKWNPDSPYPITESEVKLYNIGFNLHIDYLLLDKTKLKVFVSPGIKWELNIGNECRNSISDGSYSYKNYHRINTENPDNILGGSLGLLMKYKIAKKVGITFTPDYTVFFRNYVRANDALYQRLSLNLGLEYNF
jgi:hypothetical protein